MGSHMLRNSDILHSGLKEIHVKGTTLNPAPPGHLVRHCHRRLQALGLARGINSSSFFGIRIVPPQQSNACYEMPISNNKIQFQWNATYALQVDWA